MLVWLLHKIEKKKLMWGNFQKDDEFLSWFSPWKLLGFTVGYNSLRLGGLTYGLKVGSKLLDHNFLGLDLRWWLQATIANCY